MIQIPELSWNYASKLARIGQISLLEQNFGRFVAYLLWKRMTAILFDLRFDLNKYLQYGNPTITRFAVTKQSKSPHCQYWQLLPAK